MLLEDIPGFKEALAAAEQRQEEWRDLAFLCDEIELCGVVTRQLNLRHLLNLFAARSPFFHGGLRGPEHVAQYFWITSPHFAPGDLAKRDAFLSDIALRVQYREAVETIDDYLDAVFMDRPAASRSTLAAVATTSFVAAFIDEIASEYHWPPEVIMGCPLAGLYQLLRRIERRRNPKAPAFNTPTDRVKRDFLRRLNKPKGRAKK